MESLLNAGASVNAKNKKGITPLMIAVAKGHIKATQVFVKQPSIDPQQQVNNTEQYLVFFNSHCSQDADGDTALHYAVLKEKFECISLLLETGANPTVRNNNGFTAMHTAAKKGSVL